MPHVNCLNGSAPPESPMPSDINPLRTTIRPGDHVRPTTAARRRCQEPPPAGTPSATAHRATSTHGQCYLPFSERHLQSHGPPEASARVGGGYIREQYCSGAALCRTVGPPSSQEMPAAKGNPQWNFA
ncbi:hypothetical protein N3K66_000857 [Trichothecium roseum]|uniref:Uncharacterized protein n=1 Tax=Trichothecium roseum TaxID=47278 RepID=A0ACC0VFT1_9HYPO|nr:hypothetical protein N3K66_000857 [Trichothecium roseum]